jgi:hypothetical protein
MMANVLAVFAHFERRLIGQRTKDALAVKISEGPSRQILAEDGSELRSDVSRPYRPDGPRPLASVDGVRRGEASLWIEDPTTGGAGRAASQRSLCGSLIANGISPPMFDAARISRLAIWGSGLTGDLLEDTAAPSQVPVPPRRADGGQLISPVDCRPTHRVIRLVRTNDASQKSLEPV